MRATNEAVQQAIAEAESAANPGKTAQVPPTDPADPSGPTDPGAPAGQ